MNKIKLYHFSKADFTGKIKTEYFALNSYTLNDKKSCTIKRAFFYLKNNPLEYRFKNYTYLYITEIDKNKLYNLKTDKKKLIDKYILGGIVNIHNLITEIKKLDYIGIIYNTGIDIVVVFKDLRIYKKNRRGVYKMKVTNKNRVTAIIDYEQGDLNNDDTLELFCHLIKTGLAWSLQGSYGRIASSLIEGGYISKEGKILKLVN